MNETLKLEIDMESANLIRLGKVGQNRTKPRLLRVTVNDMDLKRKVLSASKRLKNHEKYSSVFLTPDLTPRQRKVAF